MIIIKLIKAINDFLNSLDDVNNMLYKVNNKAIIKDNYFVLNNKRIYVTRDRAKQLLNNNRIKYIELN